MITHRERIQACLQGEIVDRPPIALWRHFPVDDQSPEALAEAHLAFQRIYDFDILKVTPASSYSVKDWGVEDRWEGNTEGTRAYTKHVINAPADWESLAPLDPGAPHLSGQIKSLGLIRRALGEETPILQTVFSPLAQAKHLAGEGTLLSHLRRFPEAVEHGLRTIAESTKRFIRAAAEIGIDGIFLAVQHAQTGALSQEEFSRFGRPWDLNLLEAAGGMWCNILHLHGEELYFDAVADYPIAIVNWHDRETAPRLTEAQSLRSGTVCGGLSRNTLVLGSPAEILKEGADALTSTHGRRMILSTGCVVPIIAPHSNVLAARRVVETWPAR
jgi:uroporphyrinogen decarboxylase